MVEEVFEGTSFAATTRNGAARVEPSSHGQLAKKPPASVKRIGLDGSADRKGSFLNDIASSSSSHKNRGTCGSSCPNSVVYTP